MIPWRADRASRWQARSDCSAGALDRPCPKTQQPPVLAKTTTPRYPGSCRGRGTSRASAAPLPATSFSRRGGSGGYGGAQEGGAGDEVGVGICGRLPAASGTSPAISWGSPRLLSSSPLPNPLRLPVPLVLPSRSARA